MQRPTNRYLKYLATALALIAVGSCSKTPEEPSNSKAYRVTSRSQLIGGPTALGDIGDYMLENGEVRVLVQDKVFNRGAGVFGGSLIDADLARATNEGGPLGGSGNDSFGEMFPAFFLEMINPEEIVVVNDGSDGKAAIVEVRGRGGEFVTMLRYLNQLMLSAYKEPPELLRQVLGGEPPDSDSEPNLALRTRYVLEPGARHVRVESSMRNISERTLELPPASIVTAIQGVLGGVDLGGFRIPTGHVLGFGKLSEIFLPGLGYDIELGLRDASAEPVDLPAFPGFLTPIVASTNENGVNYGFATLEDPDTNYVYQRDQSGLYGGRAAPDDMLYLFNASGFGGVFTNEAPATLEPGDEWTYTNFLLIGDGDVASLMDEYFAIRGRDTQTVGGRVIDDTTGSAVQAKESVLIYQDDADSCENGTIYNQVFTIAGGRFQLELPTGDYCARATGSGRPLGDFKRFTVGSSGAGALELMAKGRGRIVARVVSEDGVPMPSKLTIVGVHEYRENPNYREFLYDETAGEPHRPTDLVPDTPDDPMTRRYIEDMAYGGADGLVELAVRPGKYTVFLSRGVEFDIFSREVEVMPGGTVRVSATLPRVVDTTGYVSGDFHMHQAGSIDSGLDYNERVISVAAEGVEVVVSTEHNYISDLEPYVYRNELNPFMKSVVGLELTTFEAGHFNGFPVDRSLERMNRGSFAWQQIPPDRIFNELRELAPQGTDNIIQVNHPRTPILGYFAQHNVDPFDATVDLPINEGGGLATTLISPNGPAFIEVDETGGYRSTFSWNFDAIEIFNGPHLEELRHFRMPFDKNAATGDPAALPAATRQGLAESYLTEADTGLDAELATFANERDGTDLTADDIEVLGEAERQTLIDAWVHSKIPDQWDVLCDGDAILHPGGLDDWYNILNTTREDGSYRKYTATGNSDSHSAHLDPPGLPRNFFFVGHDNPERVTDAQLVEALQKHHNIVSNGPWVDFSVAGANVGAEVDRAGPVEMEVVIRAAPWVGADRFRIIANGEVVRGIDPSQSSDFWGWIPVELNGNGEFTGTYTYDTAGRDTWFVVEVESDTSMFPVIEPQDIPPFNFADVIGGLAGAFGFGAGVVGLQPDFVFPLTGFAFTNPIWVIADGDGTFSPPNPAVMRCNGGVYGPQSVNGLIDAEALRRSLEGRLKSTRLPRLTPPPSPLARPKGEARDLRVIFEAWGHRH